jgi:hypothetical protein
MTPAPVMPPSRRVGRRLSFRPAGTANPGKNTCRSDRAQRCLAQLPPPWPGHLEALDRLSPTKPGRGQDALPQALGRARHVSRLRPTGRRASNQGRDPKPLRRPRNTDHAARRIGLSRERDTPVLSGLAQQSRFTQGRSDRVLPPGPWKRSILPPGLWCATVPRRPVGPTLQPLFRAAFSSLALISSSRTSSLGRQL